jgi:hypothetical protein
MPPLQMISLDVTSVMGCRNISEDLRTHRGGQAEGYARCWSPGIERRPGGLDPRRSRILPAKYMDM